MGRKSKKGKKQFQDAAEEQLPESVPRPKLAEIKGGRANTEGKESQIVHSVPKILGNKRFYQNEFDAFSKYYKALTADNAIMQYSTAVSDLEYNSPVCPLFKIANKMQHSWNFDDKPLKKPNDKLLYATAKVQLRSTTEKGRHLVACSALKKSEIIIKEPATVIQVNPSCSCTGNENTQYRCHYCANLCSERYFSCKTCKIVVFCSDDCLNKAYNEFHQYECDGFQRHYWSLKDTDYSYLAFRIMLYGANHHFKTIPADPDVYGNAQNNYPSIYRLKSNFSSLPVEKVYEILESCAKTVIYLIFRTNFFTRLSTTDRYSHYLYVGALLVKHYCQAATNNILLRFPNVNAGYSFNVAGATGKAICPTTAMLNHSCSPNAAIIPYGNKIVVKALRNIAANEEITVCYQEINALARFEDRQLIARELFDFRCLCSLCYHELTWEQTPYLCEGCERGTAKKVVIDSKILGYCSRCDSYFGFPIEEERHAGICKQIFRKTIQERYLHNILECYKKLFPENSLMFLDIWKLLYAKYSHCADDLLMTIKYGMLMFNVMENYVPRLYKPFLEAKLQFIGQVLEKPQFLNISEVKGDEFDNLCQFSEDLLKLKKDIDFYVPYRCAERYLSDWVTALARVQMYLQILD